MNIGQKLKEKRTASGMSQEALAERIGVTRQTISSWENNRSYPDIGSILKLSDLYDVSLDELLKEDENMRKHVEKTAGMADKVLNVLFVTSVLLLPLSMLLWNWEMMFLGGAVKMISMVLMFVYLFFLLRINREPWFVWLFAVICWGALYLPDFLRLLAVGTTDGMSVEYIILGVLLIYSSGSVFKSKLAFWQTLVIYFGVPLYIVAAPMVPQILEEGMYPAQDNPFNHTYRVAEVHSQMEGVELPKLIVLGYNKELLIDDEGIGFFEEQPREEGTSFREWNMVPENDPTDLYVMQGHIGDIEHLTLDWRSYRPVSDVVWEDRLWSVELERVPVMTLYIKQQEKNVISHSSLPIQWMPEGSEWDYGDIRFGGTPLLKPDDERTIALKPEDKTINELNVTLEIHSSGQVETQQHLLKRDLLGEFHMPEIPLDADFVFVRIPWKDGEYMFRLMPE